MSIRACADAVISAILQIVAACACIAVGSAGSMAEGTGTITSLTKVVGSVSVVSIGAGSQAVVVFAEVDDASKISTLCTICA